MDVGLSHITSGNPAFSLSHNFFLNYNNNNARLEIDFSSRGAIFLPGVSICIALFGIEEQFL
jgi:hypothetical protein